MDMYEWFIFSVLWLMIWSVLYAVKPRLRKEMLLMGVVTSFAGLTEPFFVPRYWSPASLFDLNARLGFDIESIIFSFALGGIASVLYEAVLDIEHRKISGHGSHARRWIHFSSFAIFPISFFTLIFMTSINPIYAHLISLSIGCVAGIACRPDLIRKSLVGGVLFTALYISFFYFVNMTAPDFVYSWNLSELSGILISNIPLEEIGFAFLFGFLWSGLHEHLMGYRIIVKKS